MGVGINSSGCPKTPPSATYIKHLLGLPRGIQIGWLWLDEILRRISVGLAHAMHYSYVVLEAFESEIGPHPTRTGSEMQQRQV